jgi:hypothetical protein
MTKQDEETVRAGLAALNRRDVDGMLATLHPDAELIPLKAVLEGTVYRGHEGLRRWLSDMYEDWDDLRIDVEEVRGLAGAGAGPLPCAGALQRSAPGSARRVDLPDARRPGRPAALLPRRAGR